MQQVHQGKTQSGIPGLFTGNYLAFGLTWGYKHKWNAMTHDERVAWCDRMGFQLTGETTNVE